MDELKLAWNEFKESTHELTDFSKEEIRISISQESRGVMGKLKKQVLKKLLACVFFTLVLAVFIPFAYPFPSQVLLLILLGAYLVGSILLFQEYKELKRKFDLTLSMSDHLIFFRNRIKKVIVFEEMICLALYPMSLTAGFMLGQASAREDGTYLDKEEDWIALIISMIVLTPLAHFFAQWMNRRSFGKHLKALDSNILEIQRVED